MAVLLVLLFASLGYLMYLLWHLDSELDLVYRELPVPEPVVPVVPLMVYRELLQKAV